MFFDGWTGIARTIIVGTLAYIALIAILRISGKRTLAKMNAFDLIVTVALGSTLATILLSEDVALAEGVTAFLTLIALQYVIARLSIAAPWFQRLIKSEPTLLLYQGRLLEGAMQAERVTREEVLAAIRSQGMSRLDEVGAVVLETDGSFTTLPGPLSDPTALETVRREPEPPPGGVRTDSRSAGRAGRGPR